MGLSGEAGFGPRATRLRPDRSTPSAYRVPRALTRSRGEFYHPTPGELRALLWAICESADATRKKIIPPFGEFKVAPRTAVWQA